MEVINYTVRRVKHGFVNNTEYDGGYAFQVFSTGILYRLSDT